jgi:hypothetical protein
MTTTSKSSKGKAIMVLPYTPGAVRVTEEQAKLLFTADVISKGEQRGEIKTVGPWGLPVSFKALCTSNTFNRDVYPVEHGPLHVYGVRTLTNVRQSGYELEGRVSVGGKQYRGFTSSQLFELPDGKLVNMATIHAVDAAD